jgi:UDP-N-acetyl-D-mannosaminuronate dehydrogenase
MGLSKGYRRVVSGQGHAGLSVAARAITAGFDVVDFDVEEGRIAQVAAGESHPEVRPTPLRIGLRATVALFREAH